MLLPKQGVHVPLSGILFLYLLENYTAFPSRSPAMSGPGCGPGHNNRISKEYQCRSYFALAHKRYANENLTKSQDLRYKSLRAGV